MNLQSAADSIKDWIVGIRREIHRFPEIGFQEQKTAALIERVLDELGVKHSRPTETGVIGLIEGEAAGCVALRADIDALPLVEAGGKEYCSAIEGMMHACGHDAHTACLLGAARLLTGIAPAHRRSVKLIFQPAEESDGGGAKPMIEAGVLKAPDVDAIYGLHVDPDTDTGSIRVTRGYSQAASDPFDVVIRGRGSHGAYPQKSADPIYAACQCISTLQSVVSRNVAPTDAAVLTVGAIHAGTVRNIIPEEVSFAGIIRTLSPAVRALVTARAREIIEGVSGSLGCKATIRLAKDCPMLKNDDSCVDSVKAIGRELLGEKHVFDGIPNMGVDDFARFSELVPGCYFNLGVRNEERGIVHPLHSSYFDLDERALPLGAMLLAACGLKAVKVRE